MGLAARLGLAFVWIYAASSKITDLPASVRATRNYEVLPEWANVAVGNSLPFIEIGLGVLLLLGLFTRFAAVASALLLVVFIAGIAQAWARGLTIDCGCFGGGGQVAEGETEYPQRIAEDIGFFLMAAWLAWRPRTVFSLDRALRLEPPETPLGVPTPRASYTEPGDTVDSDGVDDLAIPTTRETSPARRGGDHEEN